MKNRTNLPTPEKTNRWTHKEETHKRGETTGQALFKEGREKMLSGPERGDWGGSKLRRNWG